MSEPLDRVERERQAFIQSEEVRVSARKPRRRVKIESSVPKQVGVIPYHHPEQNKLVDEFLHFIKTTDCVDLRVWPNARNYTLLRFVNCAKHNEYFREGIALAGEIVATRLFQKVLDRQISHEVYFRLLPIHDHVYKEWLLEKEHAIKEQEKIIIEMQEVPSSPLVKERQVITEG